MSKSEEIMDLAECLARTGGYGGFSFRELAARANVKSASIHYHFPTKEDLAVAIARRYAARVYAHLGKADDPGVDPAVKMELFIDIFRQAISDDGRVCLFLVFGSELLMLPPAVQHEVRSFFDTSITWLTTLLRRYPEYDAASGRDAEATARMIIAALDGAMVAVRVARDMKLFDTIVAQLRTSGVIPTAATP